MFIIRSEKNEWVKKKKKNQHCFVGTQFSLVLKHTCLSLTHFYSFIYFPQEDQDRQQSRTERESEKNSKLMRKHRQAYIICVIHCAIRQFKCFLSDFPRVVL